MNVKKCILDVVRTTIADMKARNKLLPFFILDETAFDDAKAGEKNMAAFQRNVFRACGLVVIVMGTDAKITTDLFSPVVESCTVTRK